MSKSAGRFKSEVGGVKTLRWGAGMQFNSSESTFSKSYRGA